VSGEPLTGAWLAAGARDLHDGDMGRCARGAIALTLVAQLTGCSFLFVERPPPQVPPGVWVSCTEGKAWPIVDALVGTSLLLASVGVGTSATSNGTSNQASSANTALAAGVNALVAIGVLYSSYAGFKWTNRCARQHEDAEAHGIYGPTPYPQPYPYPQPQPAPQPQGAPGGPP
jgi:hypothetical protein